jgi:hypothetical protein
MNRINDRAGQFLAAAFVLVVATNAWADVLPRGEPQALGFFGGAARSHRPVLR